MKVFTKQITIVVLSFIFFAPLTSLLAEDWPKTYFVSMTGCRLFNTRNSINGGRIIPLCRDGGNYCTALRSYFIFDGGAQISDQGGTPDCMIPRQAVAVQLSLHVISVVGQGWLRAWSFDGNSEGRPKTTLLGWNENHEMSSVPLIVNPRSGSFNVTFKFNMDSEIASFDFVGDVVGYYVPI